MERIVGKYYKALNIMYRRTILKVAMDRIGQGGDEAADGEELKERLKNDHQEYAT